MNRGLTKDEAERGVIPAPLTKAEWRAMHNASLLTTWEALHRTAMKAHNAMERRPHDPR